MAAIIEPQRAAHSGTPGLSYLLGTKVFNAPLMMPLAAAQRLKAGIDARLFDAPGGQVTINGPTASKFVGTNAGRSGYRVTDDGIAVVPVSGLLLDRGEWLGDMWGMATTYEGLAEQVRRITKDNAIKAVVLDIDSPGGMAVGCFDFAGAVMADLRKAKRVYAIAQNDACSAAYAIAASAHEVFTTGLGATGSIGVISMHQSYARALDAAGIDTTIVFAGENKPLGNPYQALAHTARAEMAAQIDKIYGVFVTHVAKARGLDEKDVRAMEARVYTGADAMRAGLVDGVKTFDDVLAYVRGGKSLATRTKPAAAQTAPAATRPTGDPMPHTDDQAAAQAAANQYAAVIEAAMASIAARATAPQAAVQPAAAQPLAQAAAPVVAQPAAAAGPTAADARERIRKILALPAAKSRVDLAQHIALETDIDVATAEKILTVAPEAAATASNPLAAAMRQPGNAAGVRPDSAVGASGGTVSAAGNLPSLAEKIKAQSQAASSRKPSFLKG